MTTVSSSSESLGAAELAVEETRPAAAARTVPVRDDVESAEIGETRKLKHAGCYAKLPRGTLCDGISSYLIMVYLFGLGKASRLAGSDAASCMHRDYTYMQFCLVFIFREMENRYVRRSIFFPHVFHLFCYYKSKRARVTPSFPKKTKLAICVPRKSTHTTTK